MSFYCIHCRAPIERSYKACPFCGDPVTDFLRRHLEEPVDGKYQVVSRLAIGGMGEVYKAIHVHLNVPRVIKLMRAGTEADALANERFVREARLATKISHPNVATLFDFSTLEDGSQYMVWEYIAGTNLRERIASNGALPPRDAVSLAIQALEGLDAIHRAGVVHRDVSPENLMITRGDDDRELLKIIDLGIAKSSIRDDTRTDTRGGSFVGKWKYCSPEHLGFLQPGERIDARADVYSFGVVLYEMLAGVPPFRADAPHEYVRLHAEEEPRAIGSMNPTVRIPEELESVVFHAMAKDRSERFQAASDFASALRTLAPRLPEQRRHPRAAHSTEAVPTEITAPTQSAEPSREKATVVAETVRRPARWRAWLVAALLLLLAGAAAVLLRRSEQGPAPLPAPVSRAAISVTPPPGHLAVDAFPWAVISSVKNVDSGTMVTLPPDTYTPTYFELPPGRYEITFSHPDQRDPITRVVEIRDSGVHSVRVEFSDPMSATLPDFGGVQ